MKERKSLFTLLTLSAVLGFGLSVAHAEGLLPGGKMMGSGESSSKAAMESTSESSATKPASSIEAKLDEILNALKDIDKRLKRLENQVR